MSPFEFITVLISIILGLGITTILTGVAERIKHFHSTKLYLPYFVWIIIVFVLHIYEWWNSFTLRAIEIWSLPMFLFILLYPIMLYVLAHLLFPSNTDQPFDAKVFYFANYRRYYGIAIMLIVLSILHNLFVEHLPVVSQVAQLAALFIIVAFVLSKTEKEIMHILVATALLSMLIISLILSNETLLATV
jgi:hypothetical protein